ncbi:MAG: chromosome segregation protein SMC [Candidatus Omnitrophica bacterium]|nr:chromosome segregation protein SMC [Candidatus Omnitrophota bacterium]
MRVKRLEIFGFKSFAQKTTIHFEPGVTAIVGPNGVGKSNICDSIRWVLGEHNPRDVRAPRLEDVIFNGTDQRAPLSMAEVNLTIANEQGLLPIAFTEVTITRRVYRSGESEYAINQAPCRLKDIQELFLGTGLGGGTYAIIEQGHIDLILSSKPEERRVPFEEASGVAKYLAKKQETMRRLDETEEHLVRLVDITNEVRRQVGALERAANKARRYKSQWEQLKSFELRLAVDELSSGAARADAVEAQAQSLTGQQDGLQAQKQQWMASLESCNAVVSAIQQQLQQLRAEIASCASQAQQHEAQFTLKTRWIGEVRQQLQQLGAEQTQLQQRLAKVDDDLARAGGGEAELAAQRDGMQRQLAESRQMLAASEVLAQAELEAIAAAKAAVFDAASDASHQRNQLTELASRLQGLAAHLARLEEQRTHQAARLDELQQRHVATLQEREGLQAQCDGVQRALEAAQQALEACAARRHELTGRLHQAREQLAGERAQARVLEDLWQRYEGFPDAVKTLMEQNIAGLIGPLADIVQPVPGYEEVVEAALGPLAEALVVRDRQTLSRCRELLGAKQLEACRFLVLADCPPFAAPMEQLAAAGVAGPVKQYVQAEAVYQPLVNWILNDSWVIDDIQRLLGEGMPAQARVVSRRGDRWDRRSWKFGAARAGAQNRVGRKQRWEHAQSYAQVLTQEAAAAEAETTAAEAEWQSRLVEVESARGRQSHIEPALHKVDSAISHLRHELRHLEDAQAALAFEARDIATQRMEQQAAQAALHAAVEAAQARQQAAEQALAGLHATRDAANAKRQELLIARAQIDSSLQALTDRLAALSARKADLEAEQAQLTDQAAAKAGQRQEAATRLSELTQQLDEHQQHAKQMVEEGQRLEIEAERIAATLREEEAKRDHVLPQVLATEQQLSSLARQIQELSQQLAERGFRRQRLLERLRELYQIDEATLQAELQAKPAPLEEAPRAEMAQQVQKLRGQLEGMGPVSLGSVDEYDELKRRLEFLQTQQQDLVQAREDLKHSIAQINKAARAQFRDTFERIKQEFQHYYTRLFNGGQADLLLMDEEDILECGIDIVARPPGKRLQSISLLSGGERALTAIALLFALFKVRPSPFCILDEIDAPLDEANVDRFTKVLEEFLELSQFILITHNKKTITKADSLYGVTMAEAGISQILSAKLTQAATATAPSESQPAPA